MVNYLIECDRLPKDMNNGMIALLHKKELINDLANYRPITLLNVSYKIVAKAVQKCLQPLLLDMIDEDHMTFLNMPYNLYIKLIQAETIDWSRKLGQELILFKFKIKSLYNSQLVILISSHKKDRSPRSI